MFIYFNISIFICYHHITVLHVLYNTHTHTSLTGLDIQVQQSEDKQTRRGKDVPDQGRRLPRVHDTQVILAAGGGTGSV